MPKTKSPDRTRYVIRYVQFHPCVRAEQLPTLKTTVRGQAARKVTCDAIRAAGGRIVSVRTGWWA